MAAARQQAASAEQQRDTAIANIQAAYEQKVAELDAEAERIRAQYEAEARKIEDEANSRVAELEPLRGYAALKDAETEETQHDEFSAKKTWTCAIYPKRS